MHCGQVSQFPISGGDNLFRWPFKKVSQIIDLMVWNVKALTSRLSSRRGDTRGCILQIFCKSMQSQCKMQCNAMSFLKIKNNGPPCDVNLMTVSLTVVVKSRNPSTVLVLSGPLGSSAKPPDATWMASGSAAAELTETLFQMTATQWQWWEMIAVTRLGATAAGNVNMGQLQRCQWCKIAWWRKIGTKLEIHPLSMQCHMHSFAHS